MMKAREKKADREKLAGDVEAFLLSGGRVNVVERGVSGERYEIKYVKSRTKTGTGSLVYVDKEQRTRMQGRIMIPKSRKSGRIDD